MDLTNMLIAVLALIFTGIGSYYAYKSYKKKDPSTAKVIGFGDAIVGDKFGGDKVSGNKTVYCKEK